jgi:hypothetical protein
VCAAADISKQPPPVYIEDSGTQTFLNWADSAGIQFPKLKVGDRTTSKSNALLSSCCNSLLLQAHGRATSMVSSHKLMNICSIGQITVLRLPENCNSPPGVYLLPGQQLTPAL